MKCFEGEEFKGTVTLRVKEELPPFRIMIFIDGVARRHIRTYEEWVGGRDGEVIP